MGIRPVRGRMCPGSEEGETGMKKLGVIGGLGPMATALFMQMVTEMTEAEVDQEHIEMLIHSCPHIADRTAYILDHTKTDPKPEMIRVGQGLAAQGAELIAIPCITANYFYTELEEGIHIPIINAIKETHRYLTERGIRSVGLMATSGTIECGLFQKEFLSSDCSLVIPSPERQQEVMHLIYKNVKANRPPQMELFGRVSEELRAGGAEVILLGCTELSVIREDHGIGGGYLDVMQLMAKCAVEACGRLKQEYQELITGDR